MMSRFQKVLLTFILLELSVWGLVWRWRARPGPLPPVDWSACLIEDTVAGQIRETEQHLRPDDPASWVELGAAYRAFGLLPQAEYCYRQADKLSPKDRSYLYYWAECFDLMGRTREATKLHRQIIQAGLQVPLGAETTQYCWLNIGQDWLREENVPEGIEALRKAPDIPRAKFLLARVLIRSGRAKEAIILLDDLLGGSPGMVEYNQMKSWAEAELADQEAAREFYDRSLRSQQQVPKWDPVYQEVLKRRQTTGSQAWHEKSLQLEAQGKLPEAIEWSRRAFQAFWTEDRAQQRAKLELLSGNPGEAIALMEDCVKRVGASAKTLDIIGVASVELRDNARARRAWEQAIELEPTPNLYAKLAEMCRMAGDARQMRKYLSLGQYQTGKEAWLNNDMQIALEHFVNAVALYDGHAHTWFYLAETRRLLGDAAGAEVAYRRCLQANPDHGRALRGLERLKRSGVK
jgi:tetratricopeptide (TPR) repeat protein